MSSKVDLTFEFSFVKIVQECIVKGNSIIDNCQKPLKDLEN